MLSLKWQDGVLSELLYGDDLVLMMAIENEGLKANFMKTNVMVSADITLDSL